MARAKKARTRLDTSTSSPAHGSAPRFLDISRIFLLVALVIAPLVADDWRFLHLPRAMFEAGSQLGQAFVGQAFVMVAVALAACALALGARAVRWHPAMRWVVGLLGWSVVATATAPRPFGAFIGYPPNSQGLLAHFVYFFAFVLTVSLTDSALRIRWMMRVLALVGGGVSIVGLLQTVGFDPLGGSTPWGVSRSYGTLGNPDMMGGFLVFVLFVAIGVALTEDSARWRIPAWASAALCAAATVTTYSRAAWLGVLVGFAVLAILAQRLRLPVDRRIILSVMAIMLVAAVAVSLRPTTRGGATDVGNRLTSAVSVTDPNSAARLEVWSLLLEAAAQRPITGYGPESITLMTEPIRSVGSTSTAAPDIVWGAAHNIPLQMLSDLGIPGLLLWLGVFASVAVTSMRRLSGWGDRAPGARVALALVWCGVAAYLADSLFTPSSFVATLYVWCALGLLVAPSAATVTAGSPTTWRALAVGIMAFALAGAIFAVRFLAADVQASLGYDKRLTPARRVVAGDAAVALNPLSSRYAVIDASALGDRTDELANAGAPRAEIAAVFDRALVEAQRAVQLDAGGAHARTFLANVLLVGANRVDEGFRPRALAEAEAAARQAPTDTATLYTYAVVLRSVDPGRARAELRRILKARPGYVQAAIELSQIEIEAKDFGAARLVLSKAAAAAEDSAGRAELEQALSYIP